MLFSRARTRIPDASEALPGRAEAMPVPARHDVLGNPIAPPFPEGLHTAVFGLGCFWGAERIFWQAPGVWTTAVGYAGGLTPNPTYEEVCGGGGGPTPGGPPLFDPHATSHQAPPQPFLGGRHPPPGLPRGN